MLNINLVTWNIGTIFMFIVFRAKFFGPKVALFHFLIAAPFFVVALIYAQKRFTRMVRARTLAKILSPAAVEKSNVGSWSNSFAHSYLYDILFILALIACLFVI
jgi:hypothetical protein